jgi:hypothetical protein
LDEERPGGSSKPLRSGSDSERDDRYPRISAGEILAAAPDLVLLPSEPYEFREGDEALLREILGDSARYAIWDGSLLTWHGTRLAKALKERGSL